MRAGRPSVAVIGAGILGASAAYHLARAGAAVTVFDRAPAVASGVTAHAFGWVGAAADDPSKRPELFRFRLNALSEYDRLGDALQGKLVRHARGALIWKGEPEATARLVDDQTKAGFETQLVSARDLAKLEPGIATPPQAALFAKSDFAVDPVALTRTLISAAQEAGAQLRCGQRVVRVEASGGRPKVVIEDSDRVTVDWAVLANGIEAAAMARSLGIDLALECRPAVLVRLASHPPCLSKIVCGPDLEIRQALDGSLIAAECMPKNGEAGLPGLARDVATAAQRVLGLDRTPEIVSCKAGYRAIPDHGFPVCGLLPGMPGCYVMVAHPGVILAPYLGRVAAAEIMHESPADDLAAASFRRLFGTA
ncbi:MAG: FAD-dependent oxidoreductase [Pseudomonadota bacterium]